MKYFFIVALYFLSQASFGQLPPNEGEILIGASEKTTITKTTRHNFYILNFKCQINQSSYNHLYIGDLNAFYGFLRNVRDDRFSGNCSTEHVYYYEDQKVLAWKMGTNENYDDIYLAIMLNKSFLGTVIIKSEELDKLFGF